MGTEFFDHLILNSPYEYPSRHWELDESGQPTQKIIEARRRAEFITPIPKPKKVKKKSADTQREMVFDELKGDDRKEAQRNSEAARVWINGIEAVKRKLGVNRVLDLSATPFFLRGSGYAEGTLFPWTVSDFSLMDAIECGIVKLPRVPVADNIPGEEMPKFRNLWEHIGKKMPKKGRGKAANREWTRIDANGFLGCCESPRQGGRNTLQEATEEGGS